MEGKNQVLRKTHWKLNSHDQKKWFCYFFFTDESSETNDEELYESIYEVIQPRTIESESDFDEIMEPNEKTPLNKLAEAANKKMRKLRRNWSLKKNDISKSWSRIRKYSTPVIRPTFPVTVSHTNTLKRKPSRKGPSALPDTKSVVRHHGGPIVDGTNNDTTFYITLTIEQDDDDDDPLERLDGKCLFCTHDRLFNESRFL